MSEARRDWKSTSPLRVIENITLVLAAIALLLLVGVVTADAVGRYAFGAALPGAADMSELFFMPAVVFLTWAVAQRNRKHVAVDILHRRFGRRTSAVLDRFIDLLGLFLFVLVLMTSFTLARDQWSLWTVEEPSLPTGPSRAIVVLGAALMVLRLMVQIIKGRGESHGDDPTDGVSE
ncbi:MAG: TRAP transporter small permease subunit [Streptosporangiales bacterium]|nr:TRAP transporter small permease subunit [Streptosporangiales bacterium]